MWLFGKKIKNPLRFKCLSMEYKDILEIFCIKPRWNPYFLCILGHAIPCTGVENQEKTLLFSLFGYEILLIIGSNRHPAHYILLFPVREWDDIYTNKHTNNQHPKQFCLDCQWLCKQRRTDRHLYTNYPPCWIAYLPGWGPLQGLVRVLFFRYHTWNEI